MTARFNSLFDSYMKDALAYPLISPEQEIELGIKIKNGDKRALDLLVTSNLRLVVSIANDFSHAGLDLMDLISEGNIGLMIAAKKFDPVKFDAKFSTYSAWWIKQYIRRSISNKSRAIRLPVHLLEKILKLKKIISSFESEHGFTPTAFELAEITGLSEVKITTLLTTSQPIVALDSTLGDESSDTLHVTIADESVSTSCQALIESDATAHLFKLLKFLKDRDRDIISRRFGLNGKKPETLEQIGVLYGITRERVRQLESMALKSLKSAF